MSRLSRCQEDLARVRAERDTLREALDAWQPPVDPPWLFEPKTPVDWDDRITGGGSTIINPVAAEYLMTIPASVTSGLHAELQASHADNGGGPVPAEFIYDWEFMVANDSDLGTSFLHVCQFHDDSTKPGSNPPTGCYTGGVQIKAGQIVLATRGGETLGWDGGCQFEHNDLTPLGPLVRDRWHHLRLAATWALEGGKQIATLDGGVPITVLGPTVGNTATSQKFRVGLYRGAKPSGAPTTLWVRNVKVA